MSERDEILDAVFRAIDRVRELLLDEDAFPRDESAVLLGDGAGIDSMGFVNFIVAVEDEMSRTMNQSLMLIERINSSDPVASKIVTVGQLIDYLHTLQRT